VFYIEYIYNYFPEPDSEHDSEPVKEYIILQVLSWAHAREVEGIRRDGIKTYNHQYTIDRFLHDLVKHNIHFEIIVADVVYDFENIPDISSEIDRPSENKYNPRVEIM
jgi:hypothetical protein